MAFLLPFAIAAAVSAGTALLTSAMTPKPKLPAPPTPVTPPSPSDQTVQAAGQNVYAQAAQEKGAASTILTGGQGAAMSSANVQQKTLLGQ